MGHNKVHLKGTNSQERERERERERGRENYDVRILKVL